MTNICAAIGLAQLEQVDYILEKKRDIGDFYLKELANLPIKFQDIGKEVNHSYWMFSILTKDAKERDSLRSFLSEKLIETRPIFYPVHTMPMYSAKFEKIKVAEDIGWRGLNLPSWPGLSKEQLKYIVEKITLFYNKDYI